MKKISKFAILMMVIFLISALLRLAFALSNRESNDNHMYVVRYIMLRNKLPQKADGGESFQPKLYHYIVAKVAKQFGVRARNKDGLIIVGQLTNFLAGIGLLLTVWYFLDHYPLFQKTKFWAFALTALNPALIGINSQATNDTFVILFSALAIFSAFLYLKNDSWIAILPSIIFSFLAIASKTNGWVTVIAIFIAFILKATFNKLNLNSFLFAIFFLMATTALAFYSSLTQYRLNLREYGSPMLINMEKPPAPKLFTQTSIPGTSHDSTGILSIQDGFFTFKFFELMKTPYINLSVKQPIQSSFWTLLYARAHSIRFDNWPPTWSGSSPFIFTITRLIFIFAFLPTLMIFIGMFNKLAVLFKKYPANVDKNTRITDCGLFLFTFLGYLAFVFLYTLQYRTYVVMKAIFILPALLAIVVLFGNGLEKIYSLFTAKKIYTNLVDIALFILLSLYFLEITPLVIQLSRTPSPFG